MNIKLRNWTINDIEKIALTESESMLLPWTQNMLKEEYYNPCFYCIVAEHKSGIAGYINYHKIGEEFHIANTATAKNFRRKGIASLLLEKLIERAEKDGIKGITLEAGKENTAAIGLYKKFGFKAEGVRKNYYKTQDAYIMWKYL